MAESTVPVKTLLVTVFESITEVFLLCLAGYVLAYTGVTDKATQRKLNIINVSLFTPALLFSKVAFSLTPAKLREMWIIPLGFVLISGTSAAVAWALSKLFKLKPSQTAFAICAAMFQNSNSLPIALVQSLVVEVPHLKWGDDDSKDQMLGRALTYMVLYSTLGMMLRWSWGVKLLSNADDEEAESFVPPIASPEAITHSANPFSSPDERLLNGESVNHRRRSRSVDREEIASSGQRSPSPAAPWSAASVASAHSMHPTATRPSRGTSMSRRDSNQSNVSRRPTRTESGREFWGLPEQPRKRLELGDLAEDSSDSESASDEDEWGSDLPTLRRRASTPPSTRFQTIWAATKRRCIGAWTTFNSFMTVPMWAALASIFIAMVPPLQAGISHIKPFEQAVRGAGQCSIPVTLVVLGAFFYTPPPAITLTTETHSKGISGYFGRKLRSLSRPATVSGSTPAYAGENRTVLVACLSRMVIVPLIFLPFIAIISIYDLFEAAEDPVFTLCAVLLVASPPALTLAQITQAASGDAFERLISKTISWSYAVLTPPLTLVYVVIALLFARL